MTMVTIYQANNPETLPVSLATPEIVLETELPDRLQHTTGITYEGDDRDGYYTKINQPLTVNGNISSSNLTTMNTDLQTIMSKVTKMSYIPVFQTTMIDGDLTVDTLNGNKIGAPDIFSYDDETPFIPVVGSDGVTEVGHRIEFHRATVEEDYTVGLEAISASRLAIRHQTEGTIGELELSNAYFRNGSGACRMTTNTSSNLLFHNNAGTLTWIMDSTQANDRWSTTRDNALAAFTRTTGMTHTPAVVEPSPAPANTTFAHNIYSVECYAGRYHTNGTSSLPINSVASASTWGAMRIVRTGLAQNTPCGYMFGRGNDPTLMPKNLCAIYYVSPTTDISKGEIRIGIETEASTSSTNCITYDTDTKETKFPANITAPNLTGISYNSNFLLQSSDYTAATIISNHLHVNLTGVTYKSLMGMRAYNGDLATGQEMMLQVGKSHTAAVSFVYKHNDTQASCEYRIDHPGRVAYRCYYGSTKTEHEIRGNLKVYGTITENASKTITHFTQYEGELQPGYFVESTGQVFHNGEPTYENCMVTVRQATTCNNNIIGVCVEVMNDEITDEYGNVSQPAGKFCRIATHGDCLVKCESATYTLGDILVPSTGGLAKKGTNLDIIDALTRMIPCLKITSLETDLIDPQTVCAFISL